MEILRPNEHQLLYGHSSLEKYFIDLWRKNTIPQSIILSGEKGIGKATLAYKFSRFLIHNNSKAELTDNFIQNEGNESKALDIDKESRVFN